MLVKVTVVAEVMVEATNITNPAQAISEAIDLTRVNCFEIVRVDLGNSISKHISVAATVVEQHDEIASWWHEVEPWPTTGIPEKISTRTCGQILDEKTQ